MLTKSLHSQLWRWHFSPDKNLQELCHLELFHWHQEKLKYSTFLQVFSFDYTSQSQDKKNLFHCPRLDFALKKKSSSSWPSSIPWRVQMNPKVKQSPQKIKQGFGHRVAEDSVDETNLYYSNKAWINLAAFKCGFWT